MQIQTVTTPLLDVAYEISGPDTGNPVLLLHGWPDDPRTWDRILPALHAAGFRTFVPYLRGYGPTRFRDAKTMRSGEIVAFAQDAVDLLDALGIARVALIGHDWGARAAYLLTSLFAQRISRCVTLSVGYGSSDPEQDMPFTQIHSYWYQWHFALPRGEKTLRERGPEHARYCWRAWAPNWDCSEEEFLATARSFDNPDWADITLHSYRVRWGMAQKDPRYAELALRAAAMPKVTVPTLLIQGGADGASLAASSEGKEANFAASYRRVLLDRIGHFAQREAPDAVSALACEFLAGA